jgi:hypothetical protein
VGVYGRFSTAGAAPFAVAADTKVVSRSTVGAGRLAKLTAYVDTATAGVPVPARAVVYDAANALRGKGQEVVLPTGLSARWVDLPFAPELEGGLLLAAGDYDLGLIVGGAGLRVYQIDPDAPGGRRNADSYADGPADPFGSPTAMTGRIRVFAQPFVPYAAPEEVEMYLARLPFPEAQEVFASTGPSGESRLAVCSWHGTALDPERGSFVVAHVDGKFDDWIGERVQVRLRGRGESRAVYGYVYNAADVAPDDISIPRRMFAALAPPGLDRLDVFVERMK